MSTIQKISEDLTRKVAGAMDANLFESIISLFNNGVLVHYVKNPRHTVDVKNFRMTIDGANGVRFEGRELLIEKDKEIEKLKECIGFYANEENWMSLIGTQYNLGKIWIENNDLVGSITTENGARARQCLKDLR